MTTKDIEYIIATWSDEVKRAEKDPAHVVEYREIAEILSMPLPTVRVVLDGYQAIRRNDIEFLKKHPKNKPTYQAIASIFGFKDPYARKSKTQKPKPAPEPVPVKVPAPEPEKTQLDIMEELRKKMDYHGRRYWILREVLEDLNDKLAKQG